MSATREAMKQLLGAYRRARVLAKQAALIEPRVPLDVNLSLEYHGNEYCGWCIPAGSLNRESVVVDAGLGEDVSFSTSLIQRYGCTVHGFDPTPRAIAYAQRLASPNIVLHEYGIAGSAGEARFYLPNNPAHVSGSLVQEDHLGREAIVVKLIGIQDLFGLIGAKTIDLLKLDIEGAEYELIASPSFRGAAEHVRTICIEFHHRWKRFGRRSTEGAVATLKSLGFRCAWGSGQSNEEFLFVR